MTTTIIVILCVVIIAMSIERKFLSDTIKKSLLCIEKQSEEIDKKEIELRRSYKLMDKYTQEIEKYQRKIAQLEHENEAYENNKKLAEAELAKALTDLEKQKNIYRNQVETIKDLEHKKEEQSWSIDRLQDDLKNSHAHMNELKNDLITLQALYEDKNIEVCKHIVNG